MAEENGIRLADHAKSVKRIVVAGEPGGSIPTTKAKIESAWAAKVVDHCGASEVGPWGFACPGGNGADDQGIFVNEAEFIAEFIPVTETDAASGKDLNSAILSSAEAAGAGDVRVSADLLGADR